MPSDSSRRSGSGALYDSEAVVATTLTRQPAFASISQVVRSDTAAPLVVSIGDCGMSNSKLRSCIPGLCAIICGGAGFQPATTAFEPACLFCFERHARSKAVIVVLGG